MTRTFSTLFIILFFLQSSFNTLVYVQFKVQQTYIASELCVNKDKAINTCKGNCYLKAHLQKDDVDSDFSISYLKEKVELYFNEYYLPAFVFYYKEKVSYENVFCTVCIQNSNDIFHPPA